MQLSTNQRYTSCQSCQFLLICCLPLMCCVRLQKQVQKIVCGAKCYISLLVAVHTAILLTCCVLIIILKRMLMVLGHILHNVPFYLFHKMLMVSSKKLSLNNGLEQTLENSSLSVKESFKNYKQLTLIHQCNIFFLYYIDLQKVLQMNDEK